MQEKDLKTSWKQRIVILIITFLILGSFLATYIIFIMTNGREKTSKTDTAESDAKIEELQKIYQEKHEAVLDYVSSTLSPKYFDTMKGYLSEVKAYNATSANENGLKSRDLKEGTGKELTEDDTDYLAYYIGWCADESIFDSSFDSNDAPTALSSPLAGSTGLIEGWLQGIVGMKLGGARELTIPGELAYQDTQEICGGYNSPLKFIILTFTDEEYSKLNEEYETSYSNLINSYSN